MSSCTCVVSFLFVLSRVALVLSRVISYCVVLYSCCIMLCRVVTRVVFQTRSMLLAPLFYNIEQINTGISYVDRNRSKETFTNSTLQNINNTNVISDMRTCFFQKDNVAQYFHMYGGNKKSYILKQPASQICIWI